MVRIRRVLSVWCVTLAVGWAAAAVAGPAENLVDAASRGDAGAVQALLGEGVDVNAKMGAGGETALTEAKNPEVRALLVRAGAKP